MIGEGEFSLKEFGPKIPIDLAAWTAVVSVTSEVIPNQGNDQQLLEI